MTTGLVSKRLRLGSGASTDSNLGEPLCTVTTRVRFDVESTTLAAPPFAPEHHTRVRQIAAFLRAHGALDQREFVTLQIEGKSFDVMDIGRRMLTPCELCRAQGFRGWQKSWYYNAWLAPTLLEKDVQGSTSGSSDHATSAEQATSSFLEPVQSGPAVVYALINLGHGLLKLHSPERSFSPANGVARSDVSRLPTEIAASARHLVPSGHELATEMATGRAARPPSDRPSTPPRSGATFATSSGAATKLDAADAVEPTATRSEASRFTTSQDGPGSPTFDAILRTLSSYVADATTSSIPA